MNDKPRLFNLPDQMPLYQLLVALALIVLLGSVLSFLLIMPGLLIFNSDLSVISQQSEMLSVNELHFIRYLLVTQDVALMLVPSYIFLILMKRDSGFALPELRIPDWKDLSMVVLLTLCVIPVTTFAGEINTMMRFPAGLSGIEEWMKEKEQNAGSLIQSLLTTGTFGMMMVNLFSLALMPAIAEEFIFRGVFQQIFSRLFRSGHLAIWITAFIFSAIHFQFFGFLPRFILGLVFGYLFYWSGTLWLPVTAHFFNNSFPVILSYLQGIEEVISPAGIPLWKQALGLPVPVLISILILVYFRRSFVTAKSQTHENDGNFKIGGTL